ncbi:hypothetical protein [Mycolicibacterium fortuitum]|uniref:hypothetical protein n=1 Tax=Mycolicibacterium fortuitum TaxID=1766 RepID=UPI001055C445|nr:hypothetical protein [Mycolicibacterium fortuitum]
MTSTTLFKLVSAPAAALRTVLAATTLAAVAALPGTGVAAADPMTVCPPNQPSYWNGQPCFPQPCMPPYAPGVPPCFMPPPQIGPNGIPVFG